MNRTILIERWARIRRLLPTDVYVWMKALLLTFVAIQAARLLWAIVAPVGPLGEWRPAQARLLSPQAQSAALASVDPFFRSGPQAAQAEAEATNLSLQLFGVIENRGSGSGSAIIGTPDGEQASYVVGAEIEPGIRLAAVFFDYVVLDRGGRQEKLFLDQSQEAQIVEPGTGGSVAPGGSAPPLTAAAVRQAVSFNPRLQNNRLTGIIVNSAGDTALFNSIGFRPGDIIVSVNGARITSQADLNQLQSSITPGARLSLVVERGAQAVPIALNIAGN